MVFIFIKQNSKSKNLESILLEIAVYIREIYFLWMQLIPFCSFQRNCWYFWPVKGMLSISPKSCKFKSMDSSFIIDRRLLVLSLVFSLWFIKIFKWKWKTSNTPKKDISKNLVRESFAFQSCYKHKVPKLINRVWELCQIAILYPVDKWY